MSRIIRVGSRESKLAVIQSELVIEAMRACDPSIQIELVTMKTTGDKILDRTLDKVTPVCTAWRGSCMRCASSIRIWTLK